MTVRLGHIDYLNTFPVFFGLESGAVPADYHLVKGPPTLLNRLFLAGELEVTAISSVEYGRHAEVCRILPDLSVGADGEVGSILLFSRRPPEPGLRWRVALTSSSATSVVLLKILMQKHWRIEASYHTQEPDLETMLAGADAVLLIGDDALLAAQGTDLVVTDLGRAWKEYTGLLMVYALWVVRADFAEREPESVATLSRVLRASKAYAQSHRAAMLVRAGEMRPLPAAVLDWYFQQIRHDFGPEYRRALARYYAEAAAIGEMPEPPVIRVWGEDQ